MNEIEDLERHLRSWAPRRPSAKVERRLFRPKPEASALPRVKFRLSWLAPVSAALLLTVAFFRQHDGPALANSASSSWMVAMMLSNRSASAYLPVSYSIDENRLPQETFEWTLSGAATSSVSSLPAGGAD